MDDDRLSEFDKASSAGFDYDLRMTNCKRTFFGDTMGQWIIGVL